MPSKFLKGLAVAGGLGLVVGIGSGRHRAGEIPMDKDSVPLLDRLDRIELRISAIEARPVAEMDEYIQRQARELELFQSQMEEHRRKVAGEVAGIEKRFADMTKAIPSMLESIIVPRVEDLRAHLRAETQQAISSSLTKFERAIDDKVSERIASLEKTLLNQSTIVTGLSQRAAETDVNLQRLISAVERLCERGPGAAPRQDTSLTELPFQKELNDALKRQQPDDSPFRPRIVKGA